MGLPTFNIIDSKERSMTPKRYFVGEYPNGDTVLCLNENEESQKSSTNNISENFTDNFLDAYSHAVTTAAEKVSASVVNIEVFLKPGKEKRRFQGPEAKGGGSGFIF